MNKLTIRDIDVKGKRVLVRCDFNVPIKGGAITDDNRIKEALPTVKYLLENGAKVVLCSHLGRPDGQVNLKYTLKPVAERLNEYLGGAVSFANDVVGEDATKKVNELQPGKAVLLENLRFHAEEEKNDKGFCAQLGKFCDVFVNDAFGTAHRAHASTAGVVQHGFVKTAVAGFLMEKELAFLSSALENPKRPFVAILGGAKVADKIAVIDNLLNKTDFLLIGGGMGYTFLAASGCDIGGTPCEKDKLPLAQSLIAKAKERGVKLMLPVDIRATEVFPDPIDKPVTTTVVPSNKIPANLMGLDAGPETEKAFAEVVKSAGTVVWNGPMGVFENPSLSNGTKAVASAVADCRGVTIIGGGDSAAAIIGMGFKDKITHVSTGGGASLEMLEGKELPAVACLSDK